MNDSLESPQFNSNLPIESISSNMKTSPKESDSILGNDAEVMENEDGDTDFSVPKNKEEVPVSISLGTPSTNTKQKKNSQGESPKK